MTLPVDTLKSVPRGKAVWNANGGFVSVLLTHLFVTRHSLVRAKGEVFVLLLLFCYPPFASIAKGEVFVLLYVFLPAIR